MRWPEKLSLDLSTGSNPAGVSAVIAPRPGIDPAISMTSSSKAGKTA